MKKIFLSVFLSVFLISCNNNESQVKVDTISGEKNQTGIVQNTNLENQEDIDDIQFKTDLLDNLEETSSEEESNCEAVGKSYLDNNITNNSEANLEYYETFEINTTESACLVAYKYISEGKHYWNVYDISAGDELYNESCIPSYDVENDIMTYCSDEDIALKEQDFKDYVEFGIGNFRKE